MDTMMEFRINYPINLERLSGITEIIEADETQEIEIASMGYSLFGGGLSPLFSLLNPVRGLSA